jgi:hypothetical protein
MNRNRSHDRAKKSKTKNKKDPLRNHQINIVGKGHG